jgi:hypothetical protein
VYILPAVGAESDVLGGGIESVLAHAALIPVVGGSKEWFAVLLEAVLKRLEVWQMRSSWTVKRRLRLGILKRTILCNGLGLAQIV